MKLALCMGFIWPVKPCSLSFDSFNEAKMMTASRRVIKFTIGKADLSELESIARSRTEPVGRVERARVLLAYQQDPSFYAVGQALGMHHQKVQRYIERAKAEGALAALDERARPGKEPTITVEAKTWVVALACQKPRRPHLMRIAQLLRLPAGQRHHPRLGLDGDRRLLARAGTLVQRRQRTLGLGSLNAALDSLSMQSHGLANRIERLGLPVSQQNPRPLDPASRLRPRPRNRLELRQIRLVDRQLDRTSRCRHDPCLIPRIKPGQATRLPPSAESPNNRTSFMESMA